MRSIHEWRKVVFQEELTTTPIVPGATQNDPLQMFGQFISNSTPLAGKLPPSLQGPFRNLSNAWTQYQAQLKTVKPATPTTTPTPAPAAPIAAATK